MTKKKSKYAKFDAWLLKTIGNWGPLTAPDLYDKYISGRGHAGRVASLDKLIDGEVHVWARSRVFDRRLQALKKAGEIEHLRKAEGGPGWVLTEGES